MASIRLAPSFASSSRITLHHLAFPPLPRYIVSRYGSSLATRTPEPASAGFEGVSPAYTGPVKTATASSINSPGKKIDIHAAPAPSSVLSSASTSGTSSASAPKRKVGLKAKKNAITITPAAIGHLQNLLSSSDSPKLLRIGVKSRGCAGMAYHLEYVSPPGGKFDEVVEQDGVRVLVDSKALFSIIGSKMDWRDTRLSAGFVFDNPNVVDTCGCGESFNIRM